MDRIRLHREWHGDPDSPHPPLLLIHGGGSTIETNWGLLLPLVAPTRSVLAVELQGHGRTASGDRLATFEGSADDVAAVLTELGVGPVDAGVLGLRGLEDRLGRMLKDAYRQGPGGVADDILSYTARPWGFDPGAVQAKTLIIGGDADPIAGHAHAAWYRKAIPDARMEMVPGAGHLVIAPAWARVLSFLAPHPEPLHDAG